MKKKKIHWDTSVPPCWPWCPVGRVHHHTMSARWIAPCPPHRTDQRWRCPRSPQTWTGSGESQTGNRADRMLRTVKCLYFVGTKFCGLMMMAMLVYTWIRGFSNKNHNYSIKSTCWNLKSVDCPTCEILENKCPTNKSDFTVYDMQIPNHQTFEHLCIERQSVIPRKGVIIVKQYLPHLHLHPSHSC